jgi:hypothetical protein
MHLPLRSRLVAGSLRGLLLLLLLLPILANCGSSCKNNFL